MEIMPCLILMIGTNVRMLNSYKVERRVLIMLMLKNRRFQFWMFKRLYLSTFGIKGGGTTVPPSLPTSNVAAY